MILDCVILLVLVVAVVSGVYTMERHKDYFATFRCVHLIHCEPGAMLYVINNTSTAWCTIDIVLRVMTVSEAGFSNSRWAVIWLAWHFGSAMIAIALHCTTNALLNNRDGSGKYGCRS